MTEKILVTYVSRPGTAAGGMLTVWSEGDRLDWRAIAELAEELA